MAKARKKKQISRASRSVAKGDTLRGRFELIEEIGRGGLSTIFEARDLVAQKAGLAHSLVALKIIIAEPSSDTDMAALMHREARRLRDMVHPNILRVYDSDMDGDAHFMVMELLRGRSLAKVLRESDGNRLTVGQVDRLVADICAGLAFAHESGIVHADLKPGNVFIDRSGRAKLIDFNIAYPVAPFGMADDEDTVRILGRLGAVTPLYASPQRLSGATPSESDDVYSLAVLTYMALTGKRPFGDATSEDAVKNNIVPERPVMLDRARWRALAAGLALDDDSRTPSVTRFAEDFLHRSALAGIQRFLFGGR